MPFLNFLSIYTFREHHPDWKIIFIKPKDEAKAEGKWDTGEHSIELVDDPEIDYSKFVGRYVDETWQFDFTEISNVSTILPVFSISKTKSVSYPGAVL